MRSSPQRSSSPSAELSSAPPAVSLQYPLSLFFSPCLFASPRAAFLKANGYYGGGGGGVTYVQETAVVVQPAPQIMYMAPPPTAAAVVYS